MFACRWSLHTYRFLWGQEWSVGSRHRLVITAGLHYNGLEQVIGGGVGRALKVSPIGGWYWPEIAWGGVWRGSRLRGDDVIGFGRAREQLEEPRFRRVSNSFTFFLFVCLRLTKLAEHRIHIETCIYLWAVRARKCMKSFKKIRTELLVLLQSLYYGCYWLYMLLSTCVEPKDILLNNWRAMINCWCYWWSQIHASVHFFSSLGSGSGFLFSFIDFFKRS